MNGDILDGLYFFTLGGLATSVLLAALPRAAMPAFIGVYALVLIVLIAYAVGRRHGG